MGFTLVNVALSHQAWAQSVRELQQHIHKLELISFFVILVLLAIILFVLVYFERAIKQLERRVTAGNVQASLPDMQEDMALEKSAINEADADVADSDAENGTLKMMDMQSDGIINVQDDIGGEEDISNLPGEVAQYAFPESLEALRRLKPAGTSEHDLWQWVQDVLLHLPKYGLKNNPTMILPEKKEDYLCEHWLEQALRDFNVNNFSDALQALFKVTIVSQNSEQRLTADFMKLQILFRLELWVDACAVAEKIIRKYGKVKKSELFSIAFATAYMVRGAHKMQFLDDETDARADIEKAISYTTKMDVHDMLMAGVMMHVNLFFVALYARDNPAHSLQAMQKILTLFSESVIPEIQIVRDKIQDFF